MILDLILPNRRGREDQRIQTALRNQQFISSLTHYEKFQVSIFSRAGVPTPFKCGSWEKGQLYRGTPLPLYFILIHLSRVQKAFMLGG